MEHRQLSTMMQATNERIKFSPNVRKHQMTAFNFDLSLMEIILSSSSRRMCLHTFEVGSIQQSCPSRESIECQFGGFSSSFLATLLVEDFPTMITMLLAGERVPVDLAKY